ncbi:MAG TPA: TIGR03435 family protein [Bryobacteraceae bacterium]|nr:TIGR03435 family protein [Bryobacteraceae bacterium]
MRIVLLIFAVGSLLAAGPEFDAAAIKPSAPAGNGPVRVGCNGGPGTADPVSFSCQNMSLSNLITGAYALQRYQYSAPAWLDAERFNLTVKVPPGTTKEDFQLMQRNLLAERFGLVVHRETKELAAYDLVVTKNGPKFKEAGPPVLLPPEQPRPFEQIQKDKDGFPILPDARAGMIIIPGRARWQAVGATADQIVRTLAAQVGAPVNDTTGLTGKYDFTLSWNPERGFTGERLQFAGAGGDAPSPDADIAQTLFDALQDQLGLRLDKKRHPVDMLVVDHAEKTPTAN